MWERMTWRGFDFQILPLPPLMKSVTAAANSWISRSHQRDSPTPPLTPTYITPRLAPKPPRAKPPSLHSAYSASSSDTHSTIHPYSSIHMAPLPVVSNHSTPDDDDECPVCLEPLSFSFRLPGEKPHIVPECGHALHEVCSPCSLFPILFIFSHLSGLFYCCLWPPSKSARSSRPPKIQSRRVRRLQTTHEDRRW